MCNVSVSDNIITIPKPALPVPSDLCHCVGGVLCVCGPGCLLSQRFIAPHCLGNSSLGSVRVLIHHPPLTATVTLPLPATDTVHP
ncbi:unnamed protein product [Staurois parvus]|uniref:Uncharacterized protein n=1 Tax=Staurois parvus TaxID=386267 RepID=A0ABN9GSX4_9NEOB|nr:unnamed protein product [Staurois parvus]